jgi:hypothetical protein
VQEQVATLRRDLEQREEKSMRDFRDMQQSFERFQVCISLSFSLLSIG